MNFLFSLFLFCILSLSGYNVDFIDSPSNSNLSEDVVSMTVEYADNTSETFILSVKELKDSDFSFLPEGKVVNSCTFRDTSGCGCTRADCASARVCYWGECHPYWQ